MSIEVYSYLEIAQKAAILAGQCLRTYFGNAVKTEFKAARDPVTQADVEAERIILGTLQKEFPDHNYVSEETGTQYTGSPFSWIIDPLDGTSNFLHGLGHFAVSIALQYEEKTLVGVVYEPVAEEIYTAIRGQGAYLNEKRIGVSNVVHLSGGLLGTGFGASLQERIFQLQLLSKLLRQCGAVREPGSASLGLSYVARGIYDGYWESGLQPWDFAAGMLLVVEAGGKSTNLKGTIVASNPQLHPALLAWLSQERY